MYNIVYCVIWGEIQATEESLFSGILEAKTLQNTMSSKLGKDKINEITT